MKTFSRSVRVRNSWLLAAMIPTIIVCLAMAVFSFAALPRAVAQGAAEKAFADWKAAQAAVAAAKEKLADAQKKLQTAMAAIAKSGKKPTAEQEAALAGGRAEVARAEAALREAEKQELAARVALEAAIADLPDGPLKDQLKRERNFPSLVAGNGLYTVNFDTPSGQLRLNLPDDLRAGDTISGTVFVEPNGKTEEERAKNLAVLNGYVVDLDGTRVPSNPPQFTWIPPAPTTSQPVRYVLRLVEILPGNSTERTIAGAVVTPDPKITQPTHPSGAIVTPDPKITQPTHPSGAIVTPDPKITQPTPPSGQITIVGETFGSKPQDLDAVPDFNIPRLGQQGRPLVIPGPFDGNSSNTTVNWTIPSTSSVLERPPGSGSGRLVVIAESPRKAVFRSPTNVTGQMDITVKDGEKQATGKFRNLAVDLTAPKTSLLKGESTELKVQVKGLEGLKEPVPLTLQSTGVITMTGGNYQPLTIQPSEVGADGSYSTTRGITGVQAGGWGATATVVTGPFNVCLQDDSRAAIVIRWNTVTGDYSFRPPSLSSDSAAPTTGDAPTLGKGTMVMKGCILTLNHNAPDRRVFASLDACTNAGQASVEMPQSKVKFTITDRNITDNTCAVGP